MKKGRSIGRLLSGVISVSLFVLIFQGCNNAQVSQKLAFKTEYQAVFLNNSQVFFGKAEVGKDYVTLTDVYYIQTQTNQETKEAKSALIKRGKEWHGPDAMYITKSQVVLIEPVSPDSQVAKLIKEAKP